MNSYPFEKKEQILRREELASFWRGLKDYAPLTRFEPSICIESEITCYKKAARQLKIDNARIRFHQRRGTLFAERVYLPVNTRRKKKDMEARLASSLMIKNIQKLNIEVNKCSMQ